MPFAQWVQVRRFCSAAPFRLVVVERDSVVDFAVQRGPPAARCGACLPFALHCDACGAVRFVFQCDLVEHLSCGRIREHPIPDRRLRRDHSSHVRRHGCTCDRARTVVHSEQGGHRDCHDHCCVLPQHGGFVRAGDLHPVASGRAVACVDLFQHGLRAWACVDEHIEDHLLQHPLIGHREGGQWWKLIRRGHGRRHVSCCCVGVVRGGDRLLHGRDFEAVELPFQRRSCYGFAFIAVGVDERSGSFHAEDALAAGKVFGPRSAASAHARGENRFLHDARDEFADLPGELVKREARVQPRDVLVEGVKVHQWQPRELPDDSLPPIEPQAPFQQRPQQQGGTYVGGERVSDQPPRVPHTGVDPRRDRRLLGCVEHILRAGAEGLQSRVTVRGIRRQRNRRERCRPVAAVGARGGRPGAACRCGRCRRCRLEESRDPFTGDV